MRLISQPGMEAAFIARSNHSPAHYTPAIRVLWFLDEPGMLSITVSGPRLCCTVRHANSSARFSWSRPYTSPILMMARYGNSGASHALGKEAERLEGIDGISFSTAQVP
jgi:hypothetical protein